MECENMKLNDANTVAASNGVHKDINKKNNPAFKWAFIIIGAVVVVMLAMFFIKTFVISVVTVSGTSMEPAIREGESWLINKTNQNYQKNDIITFYSNEDRKNAVVSRIIAVEGDTVYIDFNSGDIYVNNEMIDEPYVSEKTKTGGKYITSLIEDGKYGAGTPIVVEKDHVFVMGDNRNNSRDSREFGPISTSSVFGIIFKKIK
ncbi:signal peptidase I [Monoglobus pectinilyticus]